LKEKEATVTDHTYGYGVREAMEALDSCCLHNPPFGPDDINEEVWAVSSGEYREGHGLFGFSKGWEFGPESSQHALVLLWDGNYGYVHASEDYTGHGCQCGAYAAVIGPDPAAVWDQIEEYQRDEVRQAVESLYAADTPT
jgi:hypothetical protein